MGENPLNPIFDRQVQAFQFKIQQKLTLRDEEIERLSKRLNMTKSQILVEKQNIDELIRKIEEAREYKDGEERRKGASFRAVIAKAKSSYHSQLQSLQAQHVNEISDLQSNFEIELQRFPNSHDSNLTSTLKQITGEIEKYKDRIETYRSQTQKAKTEGQTENQDENNINIDFSPIEHLQTTIRERQQERYENLRHSKEKLSQCVDLLEKMVEDHFRDVSERQQKLREIEEEYKRELNKVDEKHKHRMVLLKGHFEEAEKRTKTLLKAAHHLERENQRQMKETLHDLDTMKQVTLETTDNEVLELDERTQRNDLRKEVQKLKREINSRDNVLSSAQEENQELKREIWRLRHEIKFINSPTKIYSE